MLHAPYCMLHTAYFMLNTACCMLHAPYCVLHTEWPPEDHLLCEVCLCVGQCYSMLHTACCMLHAPYSILIRRPKTIEVFFLSSSYSPARQRRILFFSATPSPKSVSKFGLASARVSHSSPEGEGPTRTFALSRLPAAEPQRFTNR